MNDRILFSIVICTYNRAKYLKTVLESVRGQEIASDLFETIIVDNNSTDNTPAIAKEFIQTHPLAFYVHETKQGLAYARNRGWQEASGQYIVYTDDDCRLPEDWLFKAANIIKKERYELFGGPYFPYYENQKPSWYKDTYGSSTKWLPSEPGLLKKNYLTGGNMFVRKDILETHGGFPVNFGMRGNSLGYGEDTHFQRLLSEKDTRIRIHYDPDLFVYHLVSENKLTPFWTLKRQIKQGADHHRQKIEQEINNSFFALLQDIYNLMTTLITMTFDFTVKCLMRDRDRYPYWQNYIYEHGGGYGHSLGILSTRLNFERFVEKMLLRDDG
jgi:glycosyltransferase involved in cell wall biosynthesis